MNTFGERFRLTTFGESHGEGIGGVIDGMPSGIKIDLELLKEHMQKRKGGLNRYSTQRKEEDEVQILSGVFEGFSTGTPIGFFIKNSQNKSSDYENIKDIFRPSHADFTYFHKYGIRDYRGGGRASARESVARVAGGAFASMLLKEFNIQIQGGIYSIGDIEAKKIDYSYAPKSEIFSLDKEVESLQKDLIEKIRKSHNSIGGSVLIRACNLPIGLGEPLYHKLDGAIGEAFMGLNGVKGVEIGLGTKSAQTDGKTYNDTMDKNGFLSNNSGGILGGISNGEEILIKVHFKPTPSIFLEQNTQNIKGESCICNIKGRHDPCIAIRGSIVCQSMLAIILADMLLLNTSSTLENLKKIYG
ncbi:chorismate synthase [Helicobacter burdigaliensis]|uniref:chorismate synthase n=1 Tax=Helicobacter burdigaliensis TaxID=2315334 RepID=UPI000EF65AB4|nr:chorismate synthase [Helicobacter burdigaliensis]